MKSRRPYLTRDGEKFVVRDSTGTYRARTFREARNVLRFMSQIEGMTVSLYVAVYCET